MINEIKKHMPLLFLGLVGFSFQAWFFFSETTKDSRELAREGFKAISWIVTAPVCEVNGFCHEIKSDRLIGYFASSTLRKGSNIVYGDYTQVETSTGSYVVKGKVDGRNFNNTMQVSLHKKKGDLVNVLCINQISCFLVPFNNRKI